MEPRYVAQKFRPKIEQDMQIYRACWLQPLGEFQVPSISSPDLITPLTNQLQITSHHQPATRPSSLIPSRPPPTSSSRSFFDPPPLSKELININASWFLSPSPTSLIPYGFITHMTSLEIGFKSSETPQTQECVYQTITHPQLVISRRTLGMLCCKILILINILLEHAPVKKIHFWFLSCGLDRTINNVPQYCLRSDSAQSKLLL